MRASVLDRIWLKPMPGRPALLKAVPSVPLTLRCRRHRADNAGSSNGASATDDGGGRRRSNTPAPRAPVPESMFSMPPAWRIPAGLRS